MFQFTNLTIYDLEERIAAAVEQVLLDVRTPWEFAARRLAGARLIPVDQLGERVGELDAGAEIVCICEHGIRSQAAARFLAGRGFEKVYNLVGGMAAWEGKTEPGDEFEP